LPDGAGAKPGADSFDQKVNATPVVADDTASTTMNIALDIAVLANDTDANGDPLTVASLNPSGNMLIAQETRPRINNGSLSKCDHTEASADPIAWYSLNSGQKSHPVGKKLANKWGLYDMAGNVEEWCHDWGQKSWGTAAVVDPVGIMNKGVNRSVRGKDFNSWAHSLRAANRESFSPVNKLSFCGFRPVRFLLP
jgi:hypothetical protein